MTGASERGAEWRKWDLHLHSPGTKQSDGFSGAEAEPWNSYCKILEESDVQVFGIADYFSADGYFNTISRFKDIYPSSGKFFIPNIELRLNEVVNRAQEEVHIHILFNPLIPGYEKKIAEFLGHLDTTKTDSSGRHISASELSSKDGFEEATTSRFSIRNALSQTFGDKVDLLDHVLIVTSANNDGIRPERGKKRKLLITDEIDKFSDAFFGNNGNVSYFLDTKRSEDGTVVTAKKPVLSGCDAHSFDDLRSKLGKVLQSSGKIEHEPTWIKADPTFEGLRQIIFEPENRVYIGEEPEVERRSRENATKYIESLHISSKDSYDGRFGDWFVDSKIIFGKELVAIVGNKGSGKSAVTDILGLLGNSHSQMVKDVNGKDEELFSFLNRSKFKKSGCAANFTGTLHWCGGEPSQSTLDEMADSSLPERVEYLPQKYLERLCADIADDEFRRTLNEVIFRYIEKKDRHETSSLDELINYLTDQAEADIDANREKLNRQNKMLVSIERKLTDEYRSELQQRLKLRREELEVHEREMPLEVAKPPKSTVGDTAEDLEVGSLDSAIGSLTTEIESLKEEEVATTSLVQELRQFGQAMRRRVSELWSLEGEYEELFQRAKLSFADLIQVSLFEGKIEEAISVRESRLGEISLLLAAPGEEDEEFRDSSEEPAVDADESSSESLIVRRNALIQKRSSLIESLRKPEREYQKYLEQKRKWEARRDAIDGRKENPDADSIRGLELELERIRKEYPEQLLRIQGERNEIAKAILKAKHDLIHFYNKVKEAIDSEIEKCRVELQDYKIAITAGQRCSSEFVEELLQFINQKVRGSYSGSDEGRAALLRELSQVEDWSDENEVLKFAQSISDHLHRDNRDNISDPGGKRNIFSQMKGKKGPEELYDYLYGFEYIKTKYDLKVDEKDLSELSPGERGGLLLIFYLMLDRRDIPLIIDQPEDNLDNKSVYEMLVAFLKKAKKRRQIVMVTHNPNLAVVADAEQIINVAIDKQEQKNKFSSYSGAIENPRINKSVVDILEGTLPAFDNRRLKYRR